MTVRPLPLLLGALVVVTGVLLGVQVLLQQPARQPLAGVEDRGGVPQGHVMTYVFQRLGSLNPFTAADPVVGWYVHGFTHDALLDRDPATGQLRGALARDWQLDDSGLVLTVTLRDGVLFDDGTPMTAQDVLYTLAVAKGNGVVLGRIGDGMHLVRAAALLPGAPARLRIELSSPHFDAVRAVGTSWVVGEQRWFERRLAELAAAQGKPAPAPGDPAFGTLLPQILESGPGTGPYCLPRDGEGHSDWSRELLLRRNEHSWRRLATPGVWNFAGVRIRYLDDEAARDSALLAGELDIYQAPDPAGLLAAHPGLRQDYRAVSYDPPNLTVWLVEWNLRRPDLQDVRVRQALSLLFDRTAIVQSLLHGNGTPAVAYARPSDAGYPQDLPVPVCDPVAARRLLREAGFDASAGRPLRLTILTPAEQPLFRRALELAADAAKTAGVELVPLPLEAPVLRGRREQSEWDGILSNKTDRTGASDPYETFHSLGSANCMGFSNAAADDLLARARLERDAAARRQLLLQFHRLVAREQPVCLLVHPRAVMLVNAHLQNATPGPLGLWPERFWMPKEFQRELR